MTANAPRCPACGRTFDPREDRWQVAAAAAGRRAGCLWLHRRPDNPRRTCAYVDAGEAREASPPEGVPVACGRRVA